MKDAFETLQVVRKEGDVVLVELCRPDVLNAMNTQMGRDLRELFMHLSANPHEARCIVLTGNGTRAFCAGGDLKERNGMTDAQWQAQHLIFEQAIAAVVACPIPIIAAVNGAAFGGGTEIALGCDFIYASSAARFALTEVTLGIIPGCGGTQNLPRALGERRAKELILSGTPFSADDAMKWGMVNRVCEPDKLLDEALATAQKSRATVRSPCARQNMRSTTALRCRWRMACCLRSRRTIVRFRPRTVTKACGLSTRSGSRTSRESNASDATESHRRPPALAGSSQTVL